MRHIVCLIMLLFVSLVAGQSLTVTGPTGTLYCGFTYNITWTSTSLASSTPLTIELWRENVGPDTLILSITTNATNNGSYAWSIPTNNNDVLGTNEMYFSVYVTSGSTTARGSSNTITRTSINSVETPGGGAVFIGSPVTFSYTYTAPPTATVTITLARNTNPVTFVQTLTTRRPILFGPYTWTPIVQLMPSNDYLLIVSIDQDSVNARASSSVFTLSESSSVTSTTTTTTIGGGSTTGNSGVPVQWAGRYSVQAGCNTVTCCCLTGDVFITQSGLDVTFNGGLTGNCANITTLNASVTLLSLASSMTSINLLGQTVSVVRSGSQISLTDVDDAQCNGSAVCVSGACFNAGGNTSSSSSVRSTIFVAFLLIMVALVF